MIAYLIRPSDILDKSERAGHGQQAQVRLRNRASPGEQQGLEPGPHSWTKNGGGVLKKMLGAAGIVLILSGCGQGKAEIRVTGEPDADDEQRAERVLDGEERISSAVAVFVKEDLLVGVDVKPLSRFKKAKIEEKLKKKMEEEFPERTVTLSGDQKIYWETEKLEKLRDDKKKLHDQVETIKSLSKEET
ncbi:hypothetical protein SAMN05428946_0397 [Edaphobacillus lindanitolerans]|uniref:Sporulation lipoprotein YhcN/YlaJ (Spore_YhcN_YlaJ) n=1 Tax=Edaphobacillus lindanitolerans TaxID=550447 RepID=A0A1U7PM46_9BACI|nr:hypothetical protein SAMN05428946_0397 [Edaphobacillus lindanitolerans]